MFAIISYFSSAIWGPDKEADNVFKKNLLSGVVNILSLFPL